MLPSTTLLYDLSFFYTTNHALNVMRYINDALKSLALSLTLLLVPGLAMAQTGTVTGTVVDGQTEQTLPGAAVAIPQFSLGTATDMDGSFEIEGVPAGEHVLEVSFVGFETLTRPVDVEAGETTDVRVSLTPSAQELGEVVVTGVSVGTSTQKLGFAVSKITSEQLEKVPSVDPASALRAKTPGARIVQASGEPGSAPQIRLRGANALSGSQSPLIVLDGAITGGSLEDIDMQAVESIEIIKGAAASALYGSLAGNGVVQIISKRGADEIGETRVTVRNEVGASTLANKIDLAETHNRGFLNDGGEIVEKFRPTPEESDDCAVFPCEPLGADSTRILDNKFAGQNFDQQDEIYEANPFFTNFVSVASQVEDLSYLISFENLSQGGVITGVDSYNRRNFRLNVDNQVSERFSVSASALYSNSNGPDIDEQGQGDNLFYGTLLAAPDLNLRAAAPDSLPDAQFNPFANSGNAANPLYVTSINNDTFKDQRIIANVQAGFEVTEWFTLDGRYSYDREYDRFSTFTDAGTFPGGVSPGQTRDEGSIFESQGFERLSIANARALFNKDLGDLNAGLTLGYSYEDREGESSSVFGSDFTAGGVPRLDNVDPEQYDANSFGFEVKAENVVGNLTLDYDDTYILDAVLRRDGLSLFGEEVRYQTYYRLAGAYRLTEDIEIPGFNQLKLRASYGTGGQRPPFAAQYETFSVTSNGISKQILGNPNIEPANVAEFEGGFDAGLFDKFYLEATYATTTAANQVLLVPLSAAAGFGAQYQNAATIENSTIEVGAGGNIYSDDDFSLDFNMTFDHTEQEVSELNRSEFTRSAGAAVNLFRIAEGQPLGAMFGNELAGSINDLTFDDDGALVGYISKIGHTDDALTRDDLTINDQGYVIEKGTQYTKKEVPFFLTDETGTRTVKQIGNALPDFNMGMGMTFSYNDFSLYALADWEQGGDVYNYTKQLLYFNERAGDLDQSDVPVDQRRPLDYFLNGRYNIGSPSSYFVEDGSFVKIREVALTYNFTNDLLSRAGIGDALYGAKLSLIGRNLFTFTGYSGYDPEVAVQGSDNQPTNFKIDDFAYPNFRTYAVSLELRF
jgi:TonB-linked SusC/RagA family outer membrane protein